MSSSEAQRSPVHHATEDSNQEPTAPEAKQPPHPGQAAAENRGADRPAGADDVPVNDADESSFGGPLKIDDPDAGR